MYWQLPAQEKKNDWFLLTFCFHYVDISIAEGSFIFLNLLIWDWQFYFVSNIKHTDKLRRNIQSETQKNKLVFFLFCVLVFKFCEIHHRIVFNTILFRVKSFGLMLRIPVGVCECPQIINDRFFFLSFFPIRLYIVFQKCKAVTKYLCGRSIKRKALAQD